MSEKLQNVIPLIDGWQEIAGDWTKENGKITHEANVILTDLDKLYINDRMASDGYLEAKIRILNEADGEKQGQLIFRYKSTQQYYFAGVGGYHKKFCIGAALSESLALELPHGN